MLTPISQGVTNAISAMSGYPHAPGYQAQKTSRQAAQEIAPREKKLEQRVLEVIKNNVFGASPELVAKELGESIISVRPRFSQLKAKGKIIDSGRRDLTEFGKASIIWIAI